MPIYFPNFGRHLSFCDFFANTAIFFGRGGLKGWELFFLQLCCPRRIECPYAGLWQMKYTAGNSILIIHLGMPIYFPNFGRHSLFCDFFAYTAVWGGGGKGLRNFFLQTLLTQKLLLRFNENFLFFFYISNDCLQFFQEKVQNHTKSPIVELC